MNKRYICSKSTPVHWIIESVLSSSESALNDWLIQRAEQQNSTDFRKMLASRWVITTDLSREVGNTIQKAHSHFWDVSPVMDWDDVELVRRLNLLKFDVIF
jgi:hypothetical protein